MRHIRRFHQWAETILGVRALRLVRYLIAGGTAAATNLAVLFLLVHMGNMYYVYASVLAFLFSIIVSFTMQKFLTFQDMPLHDTHKQFARYLIIIFMNLTLNTLLIYFFVEITGMWYLLAQFITTAIIAIIGYFGYSRFVFKSRVEPLS